MIKNLSANAGDKREAISVLELVKSPGGGLATQSNILAWSIPGTEEPGKLRFIGSQKDMTEAT